MLPSVCASVAMATCIHTAVTGAVHAGHLYPGWAVTLDNMSSSCRCVCSCVRACVCVCVCVYVRACADTCTCTPGCSPAPISLGEHYSCVMADVIFVSHPEGHWKGSRFLRWFSMCECVSANCCVMSVCVCVSVHPAARPSVLPFVHLSICLPACLSIRLCTSGVRTFSP